MKTVVLDDYQRAARRFADWGQVEAMGELIISESHVGDEDQLVDLLKDADVVCLMRERTAFPAGLVSRLPNLRLLVTTGPMNWAVDLDQVHAQGITMCGTRGFWPSTTELTWALILSAVRRLPSEINEFRAGGWGDSVGVELTGKRLGLIGLGRVGSAVAKVGNAFGMTVCAWSQNLTEQRARDEGVEFVASKEALLADADLVSVHVVLSERTRHVIDGAALAQMKPSAYLVNTSRGGVVDEEALISALSKHEIAGAALDVFSQEPLPPDHPLRTMDNVVATPHLGYVSEDNFRVFYQDTVEDIMAFAAGAPIRVISA